MSDRLVSAWWYPVAHALLGSFARRMLLGVGLAVITVAAGVGLLGLSGWFISATALAGLQLATALTFDVFMPSAGIRLLALGRTASRYGERLVTHDATLATLAALRERLFLGWGLKPSDDLLRRPAQVLQRLTADLDALESIFLRLFVPAVAALGAALLCSVAFGIIEPWFGVLFGLWLALAGLSVPVMLALWARRAMVRRSLATDRLRAQAVDLVSGQTDLLMAGKLQHQCQLLSRADRRLARADRRLNRLDAGAGALQSVASSLTLALALLGAGWLVDRGVIGVPGAALIVLMALGAMEPFAALRRGGLEAGRTWLASRRLSQPLSSSAALGPDDTPAASAQSSIEPRTDAAASLGKGSVALDVVDVVVRYPGAVSNALGPVSLQVAPAERVALVGASGSGKSTLIAAVLGELAPASGHIRTQAFAWLGQRTDLFQDSVRDNLLLADPQASDQRLWEVLEAAGLASDVRHLDAGLDTVLGEAATGLSGGQARRLALARLLLRPQSLWLLDEPTEALDAPTAAYVLQQLDHAGAGRAWLLATHLQREARLADRLLVMQNGYITAQWLRGTAGFDAAIAALRPD